MMACTSPTAGRTATYSNPVSFEDVAVQRGKLLADEQGDIPTRSGQRFGDIVVGPPIEFCQPSRGKANCLWGCVPQGRTNQLRAG